MERKLAAILAADVVGYSRLMEADEAGTFARLKERRQTVVGGLARRPNDRQDPTASAGDQGGWGGSTFNKTTPCS